MRARASNFDIPDVEFLQNLLFTGLGIPKAFLSFDEASGDGKTLSNLDIRFARKVNRIQKSMVEELNKLALIHFRLNLIIPICRIRVKRSSTSAR